MKIRLIAQLVAIALGAMVPFHALAQAPKGGAAGSVGAPGALRLTTIGSTANANGASLTGGALQLQPASASFGGIVTTGAQSFAGVKTFTSEPVFSAGIQVPTTQPLKLNAGGSTKVADSSGNMQLTVGAAKDYCFATAGGACRSGIDFDSGNIYSTDGALNARATEYGHVYMIAGPYAGSTAYSFGAKPDDGGNAFVMNTEITGTDNPLTSGNILSLQNDNVEKVAFDYSGKGTFQGGVYVPTAIPISLNSGGTTKITDESGVMVVDLASGKTFEVEVNGTRVFRIASDGTLSLGGGSYPIGATGSIAAFQIYGPGSAGVMLNGACAAGNASCYDTILKGQNTRTAGGLVDIQNNGTSKYIFDFDGSTKQTFAALRTCAAGLEGMETLNAATGLATGVRTSKCICTSDGASNYAWQHSITGTVGTTTTCAP